MALLPVIRSTPRLLLAGVSFFGNPFLPAPDSELDQVELLWSRYRRTVAALPGFGLLPVEPGTGYELHVYGEETTATGLLEVFAGQSVAGSASIPQELCIKTISAARYAVVELRGEDPASDWRGWVTQEWLSAAGTEAVGTHDLLLLRLLPSGERVPYQAWIPVRERR